MENEFKSAAVSVVIPCYQCASTIERSVNSVLAQSAMPREIILVDDFSNDETLSVLYSLQSRNKNIIKIRALGVNSGAASARNAGWDIATQPYIAFLDSDDSWHPEKLNIQYFYMRDHPNIILSGHLCSFVPLNILANEKVSDLVIKKISPLSLLFKNSFSTPTVIIKKDIPVRFREGRRFAEDVFLWQEIAFLKLPIVRLEHLLAIVHKPLYGASGLSSQLWKMEMGELRNFIDLYKADRIGFLLLGTSIIFSIAKFIRRVLVTAIFNIEKNFED